MFSSGIYAKWIFTNETFVNIIISQTYHTFETDLLKRKSGILFDNLQPVFKMSSILDDGILFLSVCALRTVIYDEQC
jgi:hypothetical protein